MNLYLSKKPSTFFKYARSVIEMYFDDESYPPNHEVLIRSEFGIDPNSMSPGAAVMYDLAEKSLEPFELTGTGVKDYIAMGLKDEYFYLDLQMRVLDDLNRATNYASIIKYLLLHTVIRYEDLPSEIVMDEDLGSEGVKELEISRRNPHELFVVNLKCHLNDYYSYPMRNVKGLLKRLDLLIEFTAQYCVYYPA